MIVRFFFDFGSPNAYLSHRTLPAIAARSGATFEYFPVLLGGIFKLTGNQSPATASAGIRNKRDYEALEMRRFVARHGLSDYAGNPHFPLNTLQLMRGAIAAQELGVFAPYVDWVFDEIWARGRKLDDMAVLTASLAEGGLPRDELLRLAQTEPVKARLLANTQAAVDAGVFGSPTFLVGQELFFGKDRLREMQEEIARQGTGAVAAA